MISVFSLCMQVFSRKAHCFLFAKLNTGILCWDYWEGFDTGKGKSLEERGQF